MRSLSLATVFAALSGFVVIWVAAQALGPERADEFQAYWGLFFACTGFLDGMMQETTRAVSTAQATGRRASGRPWRLGTVVGLLSLAVVALSGALWIDFLLDDSRSFAVGLMSLGLLFYSYQAILSGVLSGLRLWNQYAWLVALDSGIRLVLVCVAWAAGWGMSAFIIITVIGAISWALVLAASPTARAHLAAPVDVSKSQLARRAGSAMLATGASAALITGFPVFVQATTDENTVTGPVTVAGIMMAVTLTRAPILVPLQRFQSALIVRFVENQGRLYSALLTPVAAVLGLGIAGGAAAWLIGPWILVTFFPAGFEVPGLILAVLTFASACAGSLMITGAAALATERHRAYVAGWITASAVAFAVLLLPLSLEVGVCAALIAGPVAGGLVHVTALRGAARPQPAH